MRYFRWLMTCSILDSLVSFKICFIMLYISLVRACWSPIKYYQTFELKCPILQLPSHFLWMLDINYVIRLTGVVSRVRSHASRFGSWHAACKEGAKLIKPINCKTIPGIPEDRIEELFAAGTNSQEYIQPVSTKDIKLPISECSDLWNDKTV